MKPSRSDSRRRRGRRWFGLLASCLALGAAFLIGLPVAEWVTRAKVRNDYRDRVVAYNQPAPGFQPVYSYRAYVADEDDEIEYRLRANVFRGVANQPGRWRRCENGFSYVANAWNLVDRRTLKPFGHLAREGNGPAAEWSWHALEAGVSIGETVHEGRVWRFVEGEPGTRRTGRTWHFIPQTPGKPEPDWMWECQTDATGFRRRSRPLEEGSARVLMIGDSVLFGYGVHDDETLAERLESRLGETSDGRTIQCVNLGVPGYNTEQEYFALRENCDRVRPAAVVLCCVSNDLEPQMNALNRPERVYRYAPFGSWFLERAKPALGRLLPPGLRPSSSLHVGHPEAKGAWVEDSPKLRAGRVALGRIVDFCERRGLPLLVVVIPDLKGDDRHAPVLTRWCREFNARCLDVVGCFTGYSRVRLRVSETDSHPNELGHRLLADGMVTEVRALLGVVAQARDFTPPGG